MERPRKAPAVEKFVKGISADDIKVRVVGRVSETGNGWIVLEDDTGRIKVATEETFDKDALVRVFGGPAKENEALVLRAEFAQDMSGLNEKLYKKLASIKKEGKS